MTPTTLAPHSRTSRAISVGVGAVGHAPRSSSDDARDDGDAPLGRLDRGLDGDAQLGRLPDRLDEERVDARLDERARLLGERGLRPSRGPPALRLAEEVAARADGADDVRLPAPRPRARPAPPAALSSRTRGLQAVLLEAQGVRAERVRLDDLGAGADVVLVHLARRARAARR